MPDLIKALWTDSVWSKIIAAVIISVGTALWAQLRTLRRQGKLSADPKIGFLDSSIQDPDPNVVRTYPLKCYVELINESTMSVEVRLSRFDENTVTLKRFVPDVLQVKFNDWHPSPDGVDRIAVLPNQRFRAWVGIDETKYTAPQVRGLKGKIGTLAFVANGTTIRIPF